MRAPLGDGQRGAVAERYAAMVTVGDIRNDPAQADLAIRYDALDQRLAAANAPRGGLIARLFPLRAEAAVRGLYVHGEVGRGKTMLMDVFHEEARVVKKRRAHFNEFMGEVHDRVHAARQANAAVEPVPTVAAAIAAETRLLCLDEFAVADIADAMILTRLFGDLFAHGLTLVATSNSPPEELYRDGLNRALFLPFLTLLRNACDVVALNGDTDYRLEKLTANEVYVTPLGAAATRALDVTFRRLTGRDHGEPTALRFRGRDIPVPQAASGVARFAFADLCEAPRAAGDFSMIARAFHTVVVDNMPVIRNDQRDVARRLILLIDTIYDHRVNLVTSAAVEPAGLYRGTSGEEALGIKRTVSRLMEMRSADYISEAHRILVSDADDPGGPLAPKPRSG